MNLLIVDDVAINRKLLRAVLEAEGYDILEAGDGKEALASMEQQPVDGIISDILMPNMDGYRLCYETRQDERRRDLPFIFYTATYTSPGDEKLAADIGADAYLRKPATTADILDTLRGVFERGNRTRSKLPLTEAGILKEYSERLVMKLEEQNEKLQLRTAELEREVAERKRAEAVNRKLVAKMHLCQKMDALGALAGGIAHDFNNVLTAIVGCTDLALADLPVDHAVRQYLNQVKKAGVRGRDLVSRIMAFGRQQPQKRQLIKLQPVIEEALKLLRATLPAMVEIVPHFEEDAVVMADSTQIHQIITNLVINANHAMSGKGRLEVKLGVTTINNELVSESADFHEGRYLRLSVTDTGTGMDAATVERIFEPFFTTKLAGEGTGLGLAVVHGIVKAHDGAITVDSKPGVGTTFEVYFPVIQAELLAAECPPREAHQGKGEHILYVDDEDSLVYLATEILTRLGYEITGFTSPREAIAAFEQGPDDFDVLVTDLSMPGMSGAELARRLLQIRPGLPVIMTSGYILPEDMEKAQKLGVRDLILKPNTVEELGEKLHDILNQSQ